MDDQNIPANPKKYSKERVLLIIIIILISLLLVSLAYIQVQKAFNWGVTKQVVNNITTVSTEVAPTPTQTVDINNIKPILPGASLVTQDNKVLNDKFVAAKNDAIPNSPEAPKSVVVAKDKLPKETLNLEIGNGKITPNSFTVKAGDLISLAVTSADKQVHVFGFYDGAVSAVAMGVSAGQTKAINFNVPTTPGEYTFGCGVPQHKEKGELGKMIVK
ncbi:MAG: cupredoxin domain-containing protein [Candidatus Falkowbacteria bacterium]